KHRRAMVGHWHNPHGEKIDDVVVVFYEGPHSYTGEDVVEISAHGNPIVLSQIISTIQSAGGRAAKPGEFTLRAVAHGKMDLLQAEAVRDFIEAQTDGQARIARRQIDGELSKKLRPVKEGLLDLIAHLEAGIDFAEDDVELPDLKQTADRLKELRGSLEDLEK